MSAEEAKLKTFFYEALDEMFKRVGFEKYDQEFTKSTTWYSERCWTKEAEQEYKNWFVDHARKKLRWSKRTAENEYSYFNLMYGWRTNSNENE